MTQRYIDLSIEGETGQVTSWVEGTLVRMVYGYWVEAVQGGYVVCGVVVQQDVQTQRIVGQSFPPGAVTKPSPMKESVVRFLHNFLRKKARELVKLYQGKGEQVVSRTLRG